MEFEPIGLIRTPFNSREDMPIQSRAASGIKGTVEILDKYKEGLADLSGFSHIYLIYFFHRSEGYKLKVKPFLEDELRGLFATRAPNRPNMIGLSIVKLTETKDNTLRIENCDMLDGTPLLDIKPYVPDFEKPESVRIGWLEGKSGRAEEHRSDGRFK